MIAVILASGRLERLYTGLSLLVSAAAEGRVAHGLRDLRRTARPARRRTIAARALRPEETPVLSEAGRPVFARTLAALLDAAAELETCRLWACAAAVETTGADGRPSTLASTACSPMPRFLAEVGGAQLVAL